jgi:hypothetical protein
MIEWWYLPVAFFSGGLLGAMVMALCAAAKRGDEMAQLSHEERLAVERMESFS